MIFTSSSLYQYHLSFSTIILHSNQRQFNVSIYTLQLLQIMNKTFREQYNQQQNLESGLAQAWGYSLANTSIDIKEKKHIQTSRPVVANINPRKFSKDIEKTEKIKQVQDEIRGLENERMLRQLKQSKYKEPSLEEKSEIICLMENMIEDYNNIVQHKHITNKRHIRHEQKDRIHEKRKKENEKLLEIIDSKKKLLQNADLKEHIKINKEIAQLYRQYNDIQNNLSAISLKNNQSIPPEMPTSFKTMKKHQSQTFEKLQQLASLQNMNKFLSMKMSNSDENLQQMVTLFKRHSDIGGSIDNELIKKKFKQLQFKKFSASNRKQSMSLQNAFAINGSSAESKVKKSGKKDYHQQVQQPYLDKKSVEQYRQMEKKIRSNSQALQIWKSKINDASQNSRLKKQADRVKQMNKRKAQIEMQQREQQIEHILENSIQILDIDPVNSDSVFTRELRETQRNHQLQKEKIFAELLRKKNNKFNKLWGTKILVKYDSGKEAKSMLKGADEKIPTRKVKSSMSHRRNLSFSSRVGDASRMNKTQDFQLNSAKSQRIRPAQSEISWIEEQRDEQHYWRMCKNEKINLLLKRR